MHEPGKVDYKKSLKEFYSAIAAEPAVVQVPKMQFLMIDGHGDPNTSKKYTDAIQALYPLAYAIKFICKRKYDSDFGVMPLEGLWWAENMEAFDMVDKSNWLWTVMIMQPEVVSEDIFEQAIEQVSAKKSLSSLAKIRFEAYEEGRAAQILHVGPYAEEQPTIQNLHNFIKQQGGILEVSHKHHHEIYLSDPRLSEPSKIKTIIRQPF